VTLEKEKFGATSRPRAKGARSESADPRQISNEVRRAVHARDGEQCTFVSADGVRCSERGFLEIDHRTLVARGGLPTEANCRLLCRAHNQYEAGRVLGADFMQAKRQQARNRRARGGAVEDIAGNTRTGESDRPSGAVAAPNGESAPSRVEIAVPSVAGEVAPQEGGVTLALPGMGWIADPRSPASRCCDGQFAELLAVTDRWSTEMAA
jgi:hypothetical protein